MIILDIEIEGGDWPDESAALIEAAIAEAQAHIAPIEGEPELSILLTDDARQKTLNTQWRDKASATNVLSFPQIEPFAPLKGLLGDISVAYETLVREADDLGLEFSHHLTHLVVHGFLHIVGYDHTNHETAEQMESMERLILARLGIDGPYKEQELTSIMRDEL